MLWRYTWTLWSGGLRHETAVATVRLSAIESDSTLRALGRLKLACI